jgi:hypothetical protein
VAYERCSLCGIERSQGVAWDGGDPAALRRQALTLEQILFDLHAGQIFEERIRLQVSRMCELCREAVDGSGSVGLEQPLEVRIAFVIERLENEAGALETSGPVAVPRAS